MSFARIFIKWANRVSDLQLTQLTLLSELVDNFENVARIPFFEELDRVLGIRRLQIAFLNLVSLVDQGICGNNLH